MSEHKSIQFVMNRNRTIASVHGHILQFVKGVPMHVPPICYAEVRAAGGVADTDTEGEDVSKNKELLSDEDRKALILATMEDMATKNDREDFGANGFPNLKKLSDRLGFTVQRDERDKLWNEFRQGPAD